LLVLNWLVVCNDERPVSVTGLFFVMEKAMVFSVVGISVWINMYKVKAIVTK